MINDSRPEAAQREVGGETQVRYAKSGDVSIAYRVTGSGPFDLVFVPGFVSNLDAQLEHPGWSHLFSRLSEFSRLIRFDKRGTGLSDRVAGIANLEDRMDDVRAVMDAAGSKRAALFGISEGGPMSLLFAATYPERVSALVLYGTYAKHPTLTDGKVLQQQIEAVDRLWGSGEFLRRYFVPDDVSADLATLARSERQAASPSAVAAIIRMNSEVDARHVLPMVHAPTLVLHRSGDTRMPIEEGRRIADSVPGAKMVALSGQNHLFIYEPDVIDRVADEAQEFLTGSRREIEPDRVLATVMFTDIVGSTKRAVELGDRQWRILVENHDKIVREQLARFRGRAIKSLGDGFLATFDGPARAIRCASTIVESVYPLGIDVRIGIHTGEVELIGDDIGGIAVNIAARVAGIAGPGSTLVSSTVRDLVAGSSLRFEDRGRHALKGLLEDVHIYSALHSV